MYELSFIYICILLITGFLAGIINTMAGGGSNLSIPALMILGLPADVANATNRVSVLFQSLTAANGYKKHGKLDIPDLRIIVSTTLVGGLVGATFASYLPNEYLKPTLLISMSCMAAVILLKPSVILPSEGTKPNTVRNTKSSIPMLLLAGFYGGFVQAGVGFILLAAIAGSLRYDLISANALKIVCTAAFTLFALLLFIIRDQVMWVPGLTLAAGSMLGAYLAVRITINISQQSLKWFIFIMTIGASLAVVIL